MEEAYERHGEADLPVGGLPRVALVGRELLADKEPAR